MKTKRRHLRLVGRPASKSWGKKRSLLVLLAGRGNKETGVVPVSCGKTKKFMGKYLSVSFPRQMRKRVGRKKRWLFAIMGCFQTTGAMAEWNRLGKPGLPPDQVIAVIQGLGKDGRFTQLRTFRKGLYRLADWCKRNFGSKIESWSMVNLELPGGKGLPAVKKVLRPWSDKIQVWTR